MKKMLCFLFALLFLVPVMANAQCFQKVYLGAGYTFALKEDNTLWATGSNNWSQLGIGTTSGVGVRTFTQINTDTNWQIISAGYNHTAAIKTDGSLWVWGSNQMGQLGLGSNVTSIAVPTRVGNATNWQTVAAGSYFTIAVKTDGTLWTWGINSDGELGLGRYNGDERRPVQVGQDNDWQTVWAGNGRAIARKANGIVYTWGNNSVGQLGNGTTADSNMPIAINGTDWDDFSIGGAHTLALKTDGTLWAWGYNFDGQLGNGTTVATTVPVQIGSDVWISVSAGQNASAGLKAAGTIWTWGSYENGQLGTNTHEDALLPVQIGNETNWQFIVVSPSHNMFAMNDTAFYAWGFNSGTFGNNDYGSGDLPTAVGCAIMANKNAAKNNFIIYPNPVDNVLYLKDNIGITKGTVLITDVSGKTVLKQSGDFTNINVEKLVPGIYFISIRAKDTMHIKKFIKK
ncbi:T9SS type A sorting domain-containing protein [Flavobacterium sp. Sd200]|uniref:T9SS type A sorting domain-containing protein n=1 Tax=Flavobacterium sp. Sd200 TaxID=2692211 RepID=UPI00136D8C9B|nr:T9SS type A sorting domain-containing protein [Flavobacterium sp. Sd200]MXN93182.1 T9SS type A sorting domain-containing protein [Flavobacterium sp. Sd200]